MRIFQGHGFITWTKNLRRVLLRQKCRQLKNNATQLFILVTECQTKPALKTGQNKSLKKKRTAVYLWISNFKYIANTLKIFHLVWIYLYSRWKGRKQMTRRPGQPTDIDFLPLSMFTQMLSCVDVNPENHPPFELQTLSECRLHKTLKIPLNATTPKFAFDNYLTPTPRI